MATRTLIIDLSKGTGGEPMYGMVTVQRTRATSEGTFEVLPWETKLKLFNGIATITEAVTDGSGPFYDSAYLIRVQNGYCAPRWGFMAALPDGTTPISTGDMPKVNPITGEGIYMDAQEWNDLYGDLPDRVSATETRLDALDGLGQRGYIVKQQAGRTVSVWDYLNNREQMIYGDTGWRDVSSLLVSGKSYTVSYLEMKRANGVVHLRIGGLTGDTGTFLVPVSGFRIDHNVGRNAGLILGSKGATLRVNGSIYGFSITGNAADEIYTGYVSWPTSDPWPTSLPGVAA